MSASVSTGTSFDASAAAAAPVAARCAGPDTVGTDAEPDRAASADAAGLLDELHAALGAAGDAVLVVERRSRRILWCTPACRQIDAGLQAGTNAADVSALDAVLDGLDTGKWPSATGGDVSDADASRGGVSWHLEPLHASPARATLRFVRERPGDDYLRRYVADREKLFSVSRSVSVSEMATTLAHELNQPIGTIANILQGVHVLMSRQGEVPEPLARALARASDQTRFAAGIIARIRSFTRSRAPRLLACETGELVAGTIELLDWVFRSESVEVRLRRGCGPLTVAGDEILLQQVFANLLRNAVDAMRERAAGRRRIDVLVERRGESVFIEVRDNGAGLSEEAAETLFVPFLTHKSEGMGVGLNICRSFVEMHRGRLWLTGAERGGCTAHVQLPGYREAGNASVGAGGRT